MTKNKKVCIVSTSAADNYGAVLQNFSLEMLLKNRGFDVSTLNYASPGLIRNNFPVYKGKYKILRYIYQHLLYPHYFRLQRKRHDRFNDFRKHKLNLTVRYSLTDLQDIGDAYDYYVSGSDQVFNLNIFDGETVSLLDFVADNSKKKSYAASFGSPNIPEKYKNDTLRYLKAFATLLIREHSGLRICASCGLEAAYVLDPAFMLTPDEWGNALAFASFKKPLRKYILTYFLSYEPNTISLVRELAKEKNLDIINVDSGRVMQRIGGVRTVTPSPGEFLFLIKNAEYVFAFSFHAVAFSILFNRNFYYLLDHGKNSSAERTIDVIKTLGLPSREISGGKMIETVIDWDIVNANISMLRERSKKLLFSSLGNNEDGKEFHYDVSTHKAYRNIGCVGISCVGCENCVNVCPVGAISLQTDKEGFNYPVIDENKCVSCGFCTTKCPVLNFVSRQSLMQTYAMRAKNESELLKSTSGGIARYLYKTFLAHNDVCFGVMYDQSHLSARYVEVTPDNLDDVCRSKYIPTRKFRIFETVKSYLNDGRKVLFIGLPCEVVALKQYLGKEWEELYTVDLICHGPTSPIVWQKYYQDKKIEVSRISNVQLRRKHNIDKTKEQLFYVKFHDGTEWSEDFRFSDFAVGFHWVQRPACNICSLKDQFRRSDLTIGDYWQCDANLAAFSNKGVSAVICHTKKGVELLNSIKTNFIISITSYADILKGNPILEAPNAPKYNRKNFVDSILKGTRTNMTRLSKQKMTIDQRIRRSIPKTLKDLLRNKLRGTEK